MGNLIKHFTNTEYKGDYDISLFEEDSLAYEISRNTSLTVLLLKRGHETGSGGGDAWEGIQSFINIVLNSEITLDILKIIATLVLEHLYQKYKDDRTEIGETITYTHNHNTFIFNPSLKKKDYEKASKNIFSNKNNVPINNKDHFLFWDSKSKRWDLLWEGY